MQAYDAAAPHRTAAGHGRTPRWVSTRIQPIAIRDVLRYLVSSAVMFPPDVNRAFDIGGPDIVTYAEMMRRYARVAGLRPRMMIPLVPLGVGQGW